MMMAAVLAGVPEMRGQKYSVASFRMLPNDVSAFISPVRDLNGDDCALIKVQAPEEFAFSTPLGIVKRIDKTGEIWLYVPKGSRKITLKHPEWGVMRDYRFPEKVASHMVYELSVALPEEKDDAVRVRTVVNTVRDTLILTRVDTMIMPEPKERIPFSVGVMATSGYGGDPGALLGGVMVMAMRRHGGWVHVQTDFGSVGKTVGECDRRGGMNGNLPFYTGETRRGILLVTAGAAHRISRTLGIFEGLGYGYDNLAWRLAESEGGGFVRNTHYCHQGVMFEAGVTYSYARLMATASFCSLKGTRWYGSLGIGYRF